MGRHQKIDNPFDHKPQRTMVALTDWPVDPKYLDPREVAAGFGLLDKETTVTKYSVSGNQITGVAMIEFTLIGPSLEDGIVTVVDGWREYVNSELVGGEAHATYFNREELDLMQTFAAGQFEVTNAPEGMTVSDGTA